MSLSCRWCQRTFGVTDEDLAFYENVSPVFNGKKYLVPPPTLCPECRRQRRLSFRNERSLYNNQCDLCHKEIISIYSPDKTQSVYCQNCWWGDNWDPLVYGRTFDFSKPFFAQWRELKRVVPDLAVHSGGNENSEYTNYAGWNKNCYLLIYSDHNQDSFYLTHSFHNRDCMDCYACHRCELCYNCVTSLECYNCRFLDSCKNCVDSAFLRNCSGCKNCFGCVNLQNKEYYFLNQKLTKEEYLQKTATLQLGLYTAMQQAHTKFLEFSLQFPRKYMHGSQNENVSGDYLNGCQNMRACFNTEKSRDCAFVHDSQKCKDCYDVDGWGGTGAELLYEGLTVGEGAYRVLFSNYCFGNASDLLYCDSCEECQNCFGCVGLQHKKYCVLNKQYTKEEYEKLVPKIIEQMMKTPLNPPLVRGETGSSPPLAKGLPREAPGGRMGGVMEWGEFFPPSLSPFGYNETVAMEYFPLTKEEALNKGFNWSDYEPPPPKVEKVISQAQMSKLPDNIKDIPDKILDWALTCEVSGKLYRIVKQELDFYRKLNIPVPRRHPDQRHRDRISLRNPRKLYNRTCLKCLAPIQTTYAPENPEKVYCENCYLKEVY